VFAPREFAVSYSVDIRKRVLAYISQGHTKYEASDVFGVGRATIYRWLSAEDLSPKPAKTRRRKLDKVALATHVREHSDMILRERAEHFGVRTNAIWVALRQLGISKKNDAIRGRSFR
jgi:transposase